MATKAKLLATGNATVIYDTATTSTGYFSLPAGTTAQRPATPTVGMSRWNTSLNEGEMWGGSSWVTIVRSPYSIDYLIVAGGGGGGGYGYYGGGGGAGGLLSGTITVSPALIYTILVGAGGGGGTSQIATGTNGINSRIESIISIGGGGGGGGNTSSTAGVSGGSGGGGGGNTIGTLGGAGTAGQGYAGATISTANLGGGGGGAGGAGQGNMAGGIGLQHSISGTPTYYAGGGGGSGSQIYLISGTAYDATSVGAVTSIDALISISGYSSLPTTGSLKYILAKSGGNVTVSVSYVKDGSTISQSMFTLAGQSLAYTSTVSTILNYANDDHDSLFMDADGKGVISRINASTLTGSWDKFQAATEVMTNSTLDSVTLYPSNSFIGTNTHSGTIVSFPATTSAVWINLNTQQYKVNNFTAGTFNGSEQGVIGGSSPANSLWTLSDGVNQFLIGRWNSANARLFTVNLSSGELTSTAITLTTVPAQTNTTEEDAIGTQLFSIDGCTSFHSTGTFYYGGTNNGWKSGVSPVSSTGTGRSTFAAGANTQTDMDIFGSIDSSGYLWFADWGHDGGGLFGIADDLQLGVRPTNIQKVNIVGSAVVSANSNGGLGGGGGGQNTSTAVLSNQNGTAYTGGGGGAGLAVGGTGGSGVVVIRYQSATQKASGGTVTAAGGYYIHTFTASGTFTA